MSEEQDFEIDIKTELMLAEGRADDSWALVQEMRVGFQEIYAKRGEDELIANICNPLIEKSGF